MRFTRSISSRELLRDYLPEGTIPLCSLGGIGVPESFEQDSLVFITKAKFLKEIKNQPAVLLVDASLEVVDFSYEYLSVPNVRLLMQKILKLMAP